MRRIRSSTVSTSWPGATPAACTVCWSREASISRSTFLRYTIGSKRLVLKILFAKRRTRLKWVVAFAGFVFYGVEVLVNPLVNPDNGL